MSNATSYRKNDRENIAGFNKLIQKRKSSGQRRKTTKQDIIALGLDELESENEDFESEEEGDECL